MQNMDREPLFYTHFAEQKVCPILYFFVFYWFLRQNSNQIWGNIHQFLQMLFWSTIVLLVIMIQRFFWRGELLPGRALLLREIQYI